MADDDQTRSFVQLVNGTRVSHYTIISKIGAGGMGEVYLAEDIKLKRKVALKFLPPHLCGSKEYLKRFMREAEAAALFSHPNIVAVHDVDEFKERPFIVLDYIDGMSIKELISKQKLTINQVIDISTQICDGLSCAHQSGVIHRDLKLSNLIIDENNRVRIVDFGLATSPDAEQLTEPGQIVGTSGYMSPEMIAGETIDNRSDIFSFGVILYELLTRIHPFLKDNHSATLHSICNDDPIPLRNHRPNIPEYFQDIVNKALEKDRNFRYQHIDEIKADLLRLRSGHLKVKSKKYRFRRYKWPMALAVLMAVVIIGTTNLGVQLLNLVRGSADQNEIHLAILPIADLSESEWGRLFCAGVRETMTSRLTQMNNLNGHLWVVPSNEISSRKIESVRDARKSFGVTLVVTASLQLIDEKVRMAMNLIDAVSERQISSALIDLDMTRLPELQDSTVSKVATMLQINIHPTNQRVLRYGNTKMPEAYDAYLLGYGYLQNQYNLQSVDSALVKFKEAINFDSKFALAYVGLGEAFWWKYKLTNEPDLITQAMGYCEIALAMNDNLAEVHLSLGRIYRGLQKYEKAIEEYKFALSILPDNHTALRGLARSFEDLGKIDEAQKYYQRVIDLLPNYWAGYFDMALFHIYGNRYKDVLPLLEKAKQLVPPSSPKLSDIGAAFLLIKKYDQAKEMLERSVVLDPTYSTYNNLGYLRQMNGDLKGAAEAYEQALALNATDHKVWRNLGLIYEKLPGMEDKVRDAFQHAILEAEKSRKITPFDAELLSMMAEYYGKVGDTSEVLHLVQTITTLESTNPKVLINLVYAMEYIGNRSQAVEYLISAVELGYDVDKLQANPEMKVLLTEPEVKKLIKEITDSIKPGNL